MTQLIQQTPFWLLITISIAFIGLIGYVFGVKRENEIPDESEVIGKDLPVGFRFMKDGKAVEVVDDSNECVVCIYRLNPTCCGTTPICNVSKRINNDSVVFKYVE